MDVKVLWNERVAHAPNGLEVLGVLWVRLEILPEGHNEVVDGTSGGEDVITPYFLKDLFAAYHLVGPFREQTQQEHFALCKPLGQPALPGEFIGHEIHRVGPEMAERLCR